MPTPDTRSSLVVSKKFTYRGNDRVWTNRYHFDGAETLTTGEWTALADAVVLAEKAAIPGDVEIVEVAGCDASTASSTNPHGDAVFTKSYTTFGTLTVTGAEQTPGDCAILVKYSTDARSVKNKPIYLFNWYHSVKYFPDTDVDIVAPAQVSAMNTYGADWVTGFSDGSTTRHRCGPRGATALNNFTSNVIRHRDFPT